MRLATASLPEPPFARSYWAVPGQILAGFYPGDRDPVVALSKLNALLECGVTHVCNLMERTEVDHAGRRFEDYGPDPARHFKMPAGAVGEDLLVPVCRGGEFVRESPPLEEIQARCRAQLASLHGGVKRLQHPHAYPAGLERGLAERKAALIEQYRKKLPESSGVISSVFK